MELQGKVALVTGARSGIGAESALLLARAGARIGALDHTQDLAELVLFLSSGRSRHSSGSPVWIDGMQSLLV